MHLATAVSATTAACADPRHSAASKAAWRCCAAARPVPVSRCRCGRREQLQVDPTGRCLTAAATCAQMLNTESARGMRRATPPMQQHRTHEERSGCRLTCPTVARRNPAPLSVKRQCATVKSRAAHAVSAIRVCASKSRTRRRYAPAGSITLYAAVSVSVTGIVSSDLVEVRRSTHGQARDQSH